MFENNVLFMTENTMEFGLAVGEKAPSFETMNTDKIAVSLDDLLKQNKGVLIDFFRGAW